MKVRSIKSLAPAIICCSLTVFSSCSDETKIEPQETQQLTSSNLKSVTNLTIETGMNLSQINAVLAAATAGQTVYVQPGTYSIAGKLQLKPGITLAKTGGTPVFDATSHSDELLEMYYTNNISNCRIKGLTFHNIRFKIADAQSVTFYKCVFDHGKRKPGTDKKYLKDAYIHFLRVENGKVNNCTFSRRQNQSGRGIYCTGSMNCRIINNTFGDGGPTGYFTTAINGNSSNTHIANNSIHRIESWVNSAETDHGIYFHSFDGLTITGNDISGWPANSSGGSVKARNAKNLTINNNTFTTSGILLYTYDHATHPYLENVIVEDNTIDVANPADDLYHGIGYWRNTTNGSEYSIRIANNQLPNGSIRISFGSLNVADFNADGGGVFNNDISTMNLKSGIHHSGNY